MVIALLEFECPSVKRPFEYQGCGDKVLHLRIVGYAYLNLFMKKICR